METIPSTKPPLSNKPAQLWSRYSALPKGKKVAVTAISVAVLALIILVIIGLFSHKGIFKFGHHNETQPGVYDTSKDDFNPSTFSQANVIENGPNGIIVSVAYPTTSKEELDEAIRTSTSAFAASIASKATANETYQAVPFAYDKYIFVTYSNTNPNSTSTPFATMGFTKKGLLTDSLFTKEGYQGVITNYVGQTLQTRLQTQLEVGTQAATSALASKNYRLASNGLVLQMPTKQLTSQEIGTSYYEVLVPNEVLKGYLEN